MFKQNGNKYFLIIIFILKMTESDCNRLIIIENLYKMLITTI
jgi:hypothetical protein